MTDLKKMMDSAYQEAVVDTLDKEVRKTALQVFKKIVEMTPVGNPDNWKANNNPNKKKKGDKGYVGAGYVGGRAKLNWNVDINVIDVALTPSPTSAPDANFDNQLKALSATARYKTKDTIYISNNLPYIQDLNEGSSQQAPSGYIDSAINVGIRISDAMKD